MRKYEPGRAYSQWLARERQRIRARNEALEVLAILVGVNLFCWWVLT